ncbi:30S ribosome-binding factor RbfA [Vogesella indigofera]|uniref:30S ribosome-binding factor RbfA n=1 Tax=Vogesella indigofera TaxID=45465 RepID=UPI00234ED15B|nr:30S ribosome-binding factor RbfA [Vogesella indigofera]MDC7698624.1 30S ribosome-binding factor RbfA [Vogesella indigofera]
MAKAKKGFSRSDRIAEQIQRELAELIRKGLKDPRVGWVTITAVEVTRDYSHAKVFYTVMEEGKREITQEALESAAGYLRNGIGKVLQIFTTPQLHFIYDDSIERGVYMSRLIDEVNGTAVTVAQDADSDADEPVADEAEGDAPIDDADDEAGDKA